MIQKDSGNSEKEIRCLLLCWDLIVFSVFCRCHFDQLFKAPGIGQRVFVAHTAGHGCDRQLGVGEQLLGFVDSELGDVLVDGHAGMFLEQLAEIILGKADAVADRVDIHILLIVFPDIFDRCIDRIVLQRGHVLGGEDILGQLIELQKQPVDEYSGFELVHQGVLFRLKIDFQQTDKIVKNIAQLIRVKQAVALADQIVKLLGLRTADDNIEKVALLVPGLDKT